MILTGTVGAEHARAALGGPAHAHTVWVNRSFVGRPEGPHVSAEVDGDGVILSCDPWAYWPCYIMPLEDGVAFSTHLGTLQALKPARDFVGSIEKVMAGTPLGGRTLYQGVSRLRPGESVRVSRHGVDSSIRPFWREPLTGGGRAIIDRLRHVTGELLGDAQRVNALLSGGLDSRVVVALLQEKGVDVTAINFGEPGTQDAAFARAYAERTGVTLIHEPRREHELGHLVMSRSRIDQLNVRSDMPDVIWTGLAGSNLLGGVHVNEDVIASLRAGDLHMAAAELCRAEGYTIPRRLFRRDVSELEALVRSNIAAEFEHYATTDMAHAFTLYLLFNRERAGAGVAYEGVEQHRLYALSPFIDEQVLRLALGIDPRELSGHRWYHEWLRELPATVSEVPWQTYRGHEPCPVPAPEFRDQWEGGRSAWREGNRSRQRIKAMRAVGHPELRTVQLVSALALDAMRVRDCSHTIAAAAVFSRD